MTSLNAPGFSLSILNLSSISRTFASSIKQDKIEPVTVEKLLSCIDAPTDATAWTGVRTNWPLQSSPRDRASNEEEAVRLLRAFPTKPFSQTPEIRRTSRAAEDGREALSGWTSFGVDIDTGCIKAGMRGACDAVLAVENDLTRFDTIVGDGDCGATFSSGARGQ